MPVTILLSAQIEGWEKAYRCMPPFITPDLAASYSLLPAEDDQDSCAGCPPPGKPAVPHRNLNRDNPPPSARRCPARKGRAAALASIRARYRLVGPATTTPTPRRSAVQSGVAADRGPQAQALNSSPARHGLSGPRARAGRTWSLPAVTLNSPPFQVSPPAGATWSSD